MLRVVASVVGAVLLLTACTTGSSGTPGDSTTSPPSGQATELRITVTAGGKERSFTLTCDPPGGTHPAADTACAYLANAAAEGRDPFAPVPADRACTEIYGGPETATVTGTWNSAEVDAAFSRVNGCEIARWDDAVPLLLHDPATGP